jgi:hypothetical protein
VCDGQPSEIRVGFDEGSAWCDVAVTEARDEKEQGAPTKRGWLVGAKTMSRWLLR